MLVLSAAASHQSLLCCTAHHSAQHLIHHNAMVMATKRLPKGWLISAVLIPAYKQEGA